MSRFVIATGLLFIVFGLAYHFYALQIFNALVPKDAGITRVASNVSYGPDPRQTFNLYRPESKATLPLLIFFHGGSWDSGSKEGYDFAARAFAAQGYLVAVPDYRLVPKHRYPDFVEDTALAIGHAQQIAAQFDGDGTRTFLVGHSAGAYNLAQAVLNPRFAKMFAAPKAVATLAGPFDFLPLDSPKSIAAFSKAPDLEETQPVNHARADAPPFLILHGRQDKTVRLKNAQSLYAALLGKGAAPKLKIYDTDHVNIMLSIAKPLRGKLPVLQDVAEFFAEHR